MQGYKILFLRMDLTPLALLLTFPPQIMTAAAPEKSLWYHYYELTRLHKFPLGSILVFWPSGKSPVISIGHR